MSQTQESADLIDGIFNPEWLEAMAEDAPVEGSGLVRDYKMAVESAYFQEAPDEYKARVDKSKARVGDEIFAVLEGPDVDTGEVRREKFSIGQGFKMEGGEGKTAPRVVAVGNIPNISGNSIFGRLYRTLTEEWEVTPEDRETGKWLLPAGVNAKTGEPRFLQLGPAGRRFFQHVSKKWNRPATSKEIKNFEGLVLQMGPEEWEDKDKKVHTRTMPVALLSTCLDAAPTIATPSENGASSSSSKPAETPAENLLSDDDLVAELTIIANGNEFPAYSKEAMAKIKASVSKDKEKKWISHVVMKKNYEAFKAGEGKAPV